MSTSYRDHLKKVLCPPADTSLSLDSRVHDPFPASAYGGGFRVCLEQRTAVRFSSTCQSGLGIAAKRGPLLRRKAPPEALRPGKGILRVGGGGVGELGNCGWAYLLRVDCPRTPSGSPSVCQLISSTHEAPFDLPVRLTRRSLQIDCC